MGLAANISAAKRIFEAFPDCAMLRRHPAPPPSNFDPLVKAARQQGYHIVVDTGKQLADSLNAASDPARPYMNTMLRMITTRCMMQAVYFASGTIEEPLFQHYGLACPIYTHFTSPIRRYADVIVHRLLAKSIDVPGATEELYSMIQNKGCERVREIAEEINHRHHNAQLISRASNQLYTLIYFRDKHIYETALVTAIKSNGLRVIVPKFGLEGAITLYQEPKEGEPPTKNPFVYDEERMKLTSPDKSYTIFDKIKIQIYVQKSHM